MPPTAPPRTGFPFLDAPREHGALVAMAHRGGARHPDALGLENTRTAFAHAVGLGYGYLETDVHVTRDGHLVAFHDDHLDRVTDGQGAIADLALADVRRARIAGRESVPLLADLLDEFTSQRFNVDLKAPGAAAPLAELVRRTGIHERVCVGSFTSRTLRRFRRALERPVATSCTPVGAALLALVPGGHRLQGLVRDTGTVYQVPHHHRGVRIVDAAFVRHAHALGRHVHVWTVDDSAEMEHLIDLGVDGLITDRTDILKGVLEARGMWEAPS